MGQLPKPPRNKIKKQPATRGSGESGPAVEDEIESLFQLVGDGGGGDDDGDEGNSLENSSGRPDNHDKYNDNDKKFGGQFRLVNLRNITITVFAGRNLHTNPYIVINNCRE